MDVVKAFSPGHITGFVEFPVRDQEPLRMGSRGAGFCISEGIHTTVKIEDSNESQVLIRINGKDADAEVSRFVIDEYMKRISNRFSITVEHELGIPVGYGLGSSGAAALSLSLALNKAFRIMSNVEAAQIAHRADLECKCGMGTVIAEYHGGFEMRLQAGAPGIGIVKHIPLNDIRAVILCLSPVSTKEFLEKRISLINGLGGKMLLKLEKKMDVNDFMDMSLQFARSIGFVSNRCNSIIEEMLSKGYKASVAMFGETIFSLVNKEDVDNVKEILQRHGKVIISGIDPLGARIIN